MAGVKRFVTYIYAYEDKQKGSNIGFAKIEIRGEECRVEVHLRGLYARPARCEAFLFRELDGAMEGIRIGEMRLLNGNGDFFASVKAGNIGESALGIQDMEGILLLGEDEQLYMSRWKEGKPVVVCRENFRMWKPQESVLENKTEDVAVLPENTQESETREQAAQSEMTQDVPRQEEAVQATEIPMRNVFPEYQWERVWEELTKNRMLHHPFADREAVCIQIELKHLRELPKRYWYLGNNSFLLHGFFNYQYLVVGKRGDGRWFIGVPGIYQRQERVMAAVFGFPEFLAMESDRDNDRKIGEPINQFGCWIRGIEE